MTELRRVGVYGRSISDGSILLTRLSRLEPESGKWTLPGGGMEEGESRHETLLREFDEETGLTPDIGELLGIFTRLYPANGRRGPLRVIQYVYEVAAAGDPEVREVGGSTEASSWVPLGDVVGFDLVELARWAIDR